MYTKDDYFKYSNNIVILYFLRSEESQFIEAFQTKSIKNLCEVACLSHNCDGTSPNSRWTHVSNEYDLINQLKRMSSEDKYTRHTKAELNLQVKDTNG